MRLSPFVARFDFGRRLEPKGNQILHGAGQSPEAFRDYFDRIGEHKPALNMTYTELRADLSAYFENLASELASYQPNAVIPQLGLLMTGVEENPENQEAHQPERHYEGDVAAGKLDDKIQQLCEGLKRLDCAVYLRIGFEFNGPWFGYEPDSYRAAWIRIVTALRHHQLERVAAVWCYCPLPAIGEQPWGRDRDYLPYYPGDEYVDWWQLIYSAQRISLCVTHNGLWRMLDNGDFP